MYDKIIRESTSVSEWKKYGVSSILKSAWSYRKYGPWQWSHSYGHGNRSKRRIARIARQDRNRR